MGACIFFHLAGCQCFWREVGQEETEGSGQMKWCARRSSWTVARIRHVE